jgi:hypothetical protein
VGKEEGRKKRRLRSTLFVSGKSGKEGFWRSFENEDYLSGVKERIRTRCTPCIENLYRQLKAGQREIEVGKAYHCWKVVVVLNSDGECEKVLEEYQNMFLPSRHIQGRYGSQAEGGTKAIVTNADDDTERDLLLWEFKECVRKSGLDAHIFYTKGCANLYGEVLGDWQKWSRVSRIKDIKKVGAVMKRVERYLGLS